MRWKFTLRISVLTARLPAMAASVVGVFAGAFTAPGAALAAGVPGCEGSGGVEPFEQASRFNARKRTEKRQRFLFKGFTSPDIGCPESH